MTTYYLSVGFDSTDTRSDGLHYDADYGFASSDGNAAPTPIGTSGPQGKSFEVVHLAQSGQGQPNQLVIALFTSLWNIDQANSYFRVSFRPAHDIAPSGNVAVSPLNVADTNSLVTGLTIGSRQGQNANVDGTNWGLPAGNNVTQFIYSGGPSGYQLQNASGNAVNQHFELTVEISIVIGGQKTYYKVDPEMVIDY